MNEVPVCGSERSTVMDTPGLWYFKRGKYSRQNFRAPMWPPLNLGANWRWIRLISEGRTRAPGPSLIFRSYREKRLLFTRVIRGSDYELHILGAE